jgi:hypothetical protein
MADDNYAQFLPPQPQPKKKRHKVLWLAAGAAAFIGVCMAFGDDNHAANSAQPAGPSKPPHDATINTTTDGGTHANFHEGEALTAGLGKDLLRIDTVDVLKYVEQQYPNTPFVTVTATADLVDEYGHTSKERVMDCTWSHDIMSRINFDGVDFKNITDLANTCSIAPAERE